MTDGSRPSDAITADPLASGPYRGRLQRRLAGGGLDDLGEAAGIEAGAADQGAVDVGLVEEFFGVVRLDAAAVLDADFGRGGGIEYFGQSLADKSMGFLGLFGRGGAAGADGPDGFVSNDRVEHLFGFESGQAAAELLGQNLVMAVRIPLLEGFADAKNGAQAGRVGGFDLFVHQLVGLAEDDAAFAVPEDHVAGEKFAKHAGADFAGESAG